MCGRFFVVVFFYISPFQGASKQNLTVSVTVLSDPCHYQALAEMAVSESDAASKAQGLYETFQQRNVVLGLVCALEITGELEVLNMSLQSRTQTLDQGWATSVLEGRCPAEFSSNPNQTHLKQLINVFKITRKLQAGVFDYGWS